MVPPDQTRSSTTRIVLFAVVAALTAVPAALADDPPVPAQQASVLCEQQQVSMGSKAFTLLYGAGPSAFGRCVSKLARDATTATANASQTCRKEQADPAFADSHDGKSFAEFYGSGKTGRNAFGKCVSQAAQTTVQDEQETMISAAKTCKAERASLGATEFSKKYGNRANAFGKCVAKTAHAQP